jgi:formylglycine-generating enzyme required for sulfatase activity
VEKAAMPRRVLPAFIVICLLGLPLAWTADPPGPAPSREQVLKRFVEELIPLTPGKGKFPAMFTMGSDDKDAPASEKPAVSITLKAPFAIGRFEVTQELFQHIMGNNPSKWKGRRNSVEETSWKDAQDFCQKLTAELRKHNLIGKTEIIRLPSEAEWEYACRAGTKTAWSFGDDAGALKEHAWYTGNAKGEDPPVGKKKPNPWGLYDMHGYVWEWCADAWSPTHEGSPADGSPRVNPEVKDRVIRGGSWADKADMTRSAARSHAALDFHDDRIGFRCVKLTEEPR